MTNNELDQRAQLTVWPQHSAAHTAESLEFSTLREALTEAAKAIETKGAQPWIITEGGDILSPRWIGANAAKVGRH